MRGRGADETRHLFALQREILGADASPAVVEPPAAGRVLVLAPHMDDETLGCGGTIARLAAAGATVETLFLTDGRKGYRPERAAAMSKAERAAFEARLVETRKEEARAAARILGIGPPLFLDGPDGALAATEDLVAALAEALRDRRPSVLFLPFLLDHHGDHWAANVLFMEAASRAGLDDAVACWGYEVWTPLSPNRVIDISPVAERKREAISAYRSQIECIDYRRAIMALNAYRSLYLGDGAGYGEAFVAADLGRYRALYDIVRRGPGRERPAGAVGGGP